MKGKIIKVKLKVEGISPLLMCNVRMANKNDPYKIELDRLLDKKDKKESDKDLIIKTEWMGRMYHNQEKTKVVMPSDNFVSSGWMGAKKSKNGPSFMSAISILESEIPLLFPHANKVKDLNELYQYKRYVDQRLVSQQRNVKILRTRPIFREWSFEVDVTIDTNIFKLEKVLESFYDAGTLVGLGDFRPSQSHPGPYGKYMVDVMS